MYELIRVGQERLIGEIIRLENDSATIQVCSLQHFWADIVEAIFTCPTFILLTPWRSPTSPAVLGHYAACQAQKIASLAGLPPQSHAAT